MVLLALFAMTALTALAIVYYALWSTFRDLELWREEIFLAVFKVVAWTIAVELLVALPVFAVVGILITHRVVGPLGRLVDALDRLGRGDCNVHVKLRRGDVLVDVADAINRLAAILRRARSP